MLQLRRLPDLVVPGLSRPTYPWLLQELKPSLLISDESAEQHGLRLTEVVGGETTTRRRLGSGGLLFGAAGVTLLNRKNRSELIVGEQGRNRLTRLDPWGGSLLGHIADGWVRSPLALLAYHSRLFVSDVCYEKLHSECIGRVVVYNARTLIAIRAIDSSALPSGQRLHPHGLAALQARNGTRQLFVADADSGVIHAFSFRGVLLRTIGSVGTGPLQFIHPRGLLMLPADAPVTRESPSPGPRGHYLIVAERQRVQALHVAADGVLSAEGVRSTQRLAFEQDSNLLGMCASAGRILIADVSRNRVAVLRMFTDGHARATTKSGAGIVEEDAPRRRLELRTRRVI